MGSDNGREQKIVADDVPPAGPPSLAGSIIRFYNFTVPIRFPWGH